MSRIQHFLITVKSVRIVQKGKSKLESLLYPAFLHHSQESKDWLEEGKKKVSCIQRFLIIVKTKDLLEEEKKSRKSIEFSISSLESRG